MKFHYDARKKAWRKCQSKKVTENDEVAWAAKKHGVDYYKTLLQASEGDLKAIARIFSLTGFMDGAAAESYFRDTWELFHILGDRKFVEFLRGQSLEDQLQTRDSLWDEVPGGLDYPDYLRRHFPETAKILFRGEIVDWMSPNGLYAIRKTFSNPDDLTDSKVIHAELIGKSNGQMLCDLTADDIGADREREGQVVWSPDSKRFAYVSTDNTDSRNLKPRRTQTVVYQISGKSFAKVELAFDKPPGRETDHELAGAAMESDWVSPEHWTNANTLTLKKQDDYGKLTAPTGIYRFFRVYEITVSFKEDGTAAVSWKLQTDH
ncbi:MAG: hypothetical protein ACR2ID_10570 [Chthoniobacterales bacterium]